MNFEKIPQELKALKQWVCWCGDKLPKNPHTGGNAQSKVDAEELAPETGHVFVHFLARDDVRHFHRHQQERKSERQRHKNEVVHRGHRKLHARQVNKIRGDH